MGTGKPGLQIGRGLARIAQILWGKAPCGTASRCPRLAGRVVAPHGRGRKWRERPPLFCRWCGTGQGEVVHAKIHHLPSPFRGRSLHSDPWREGDRALPRSGPINRSVRLSTPTGQVAGPVIHESAPPLEQVRAGIGRLDPVLNHMGQGRLDHLPGMVGLQQFGNTGHGPVPRRLGDESEQETGSSDDRGMIDDFHLWGSSRCRRMGGTGTK